MYGDIHVHCTPKQICKLTPALKVTWASECPINFLFVCLYFMGVVCWVRVSFLSLDYLSYVVCYTHVFSCTSTRQFRLYGYIYINNL